MKLNRREHLFESLRGRTARPASVGVNALKTLAQSLTMWGVFLLVGPLLAWQIETWIWGETWRFASASSRIGGAIFFVMGWILAWTSTYFLVTRGDGTPLPADCPNKLVVSGPYRYVRNPMAMGSLLQGVAIGIFFGSPLIVLYVLVGMAGWNFSARPWEVFDLQRRFGIDYARYRQAVRCWIPRRKPFDINAD